MCSAYKCFSIPLAMVGDLLLELLKCTLAEGTADPSTHSSLDLSALPDQAKFSIQLYHRWQVTVSPVIKINTSTKASKQQLNLEFLVVVVDRCLKVTVDETFPSRLSKTQGVQV